jgi:hypothetical protein
VGLNGWKAVLSVLLAVAAFVMKAYGLIDEAAFQALVAASGGGFAVGVLAKLDRALGWFKK